MQTDSLIDMTKEGIAQKKREVLSRARRGSRRMEELPLLLFDKIGIIKRSRSTSWGHEQSLHGTWAASGCYSKAYSRRHNQSRRGDRRNRLLYLHVFDIPGAQAIFLKGERNEGSLSQDGEMLKKCARSSIYLDEKSGLENVCGQAEVCEHKHLFLLIELRDM